MDLSTTTRRKRRTQHSLKNALMALLLLAFLLACCSIYYSFSRSVFYAPRSYYSGEEDGLLLFHEQELDLEEHKEKETFFSSTAEIGNDLLENTFDDNVLPLIKTPHTHASSIVLDATTEMGKRTNADEHTSSIATHKENIPKNDDTTESKDASDPSCLSANSQQWLLRARYGNTPLNYSLPEFPLKGPLLDNLPALLFDAQPICHKQSPLMTIEGRMHNLNHNGIDDDVREVRMWKIRLMYLSLYYHQHYHAVEEAGDRQKLQSVQGEQECNKDMRKYNVSTFDYECKNAKFLVVEMRSVGIGSLLKRDMTNAFTAAISMNRIVVFYNGVTNGTTFTSNHWQLGACPRHDYQCTFQPLSGCVPTIEEIIRAPDLNYDQFVPFLDGLAGQPEEGVRVIRFTDPHKAHIPTGHGVVGELHRIANLIIDELDPIDGRLPILRKAAQDILSEAVENTTHFPHESSDYIVALMLYFMRPTLEKGNQLKAFIEFDIPPDFDSSRSFGFPIRGSDKCFRESQCLDFPTYMRLLKSKWHEEGFADKYGEGNSNVTFDILITSETEDIMEKAYAFSNNSKYMSQFPFIPRWITNTNDIRQGNGNTKRPSLSRGKTVDDIMLSILSSFKLQMNAASTIGNCCSNFHQVIFHLLRGGCGIEYENKGQCLQSRKEPMYQLCCDRKKKCERERLKHLREEFHDVNVTLADAEMKLWDE